MAIEGGEASSWLARRGYTEFRRTLSCKQDRLNRAKRATYTFAAGIGLGTVALLVPGKPT